jgi:drug/metabolite transporter (DMT)-like permease
MFTCLFAYWLLGERIKPQEVVMILLAFVAVSMMIVGGTDDSGVK